MNFTPGPWIADGAAVVRLTNEGKTGVALACNSRMSTVDRRQADARLIASAPDMFALLREIAEFGVPRFNHRIKELVAHIDGRETK